MNRRHSALLSLAAFLLSIPALHAQLPVGAAQAELAIPFGAASGQLAAADDLLVFVTTESTGASFAIRRENVRNVSVNGQVVTVETIEPVNGVTALNFRLQSGEPSLVTRWQRGMAPTMASGVAMAATAPVADPTQGEDEPLQAYQARHGHTFGGGCTGRLIVRQERISYDSVDNIDHSRQWQVKEIKEFKRKNPYKIVIEPFVGDKYDLELIGEGMSSRKFQDITEMITTQRKP